MSEWEDFCDSNGWNTGSEDDNDHFLDSLEDNSEVLSGAKNSHRSIIEYASDVTIGELMADLKDHTLGNYEYDIVCEPWGWELDPDGELSDTCLDGITYKHKHLHYFKIRVRSSARGEYWVSLRMFLDAIKTLGIPVHIWNTEVAWDNAAQCLDVCGGLVSTYERQRSRRLIECLSEENSSLLNFLERAKSTDHGFKPVIIHRDEVAQLNRGEYVTFLDPTMLTIEELKFCVLAYFNKKGQPKWISMNDILSVTSLLVTRIGTFLADDGQVRPINGVATLLSNAYSIKMDWGFIELTSMRKASFFLQKEGGTIFEPAYRQITEEQARNASPERVYITDGGHPLGYGLDQGNSGFVTTYAHFEDARRKLESYRGTH
ncbi:hypothetical protein [Pseudomonas fluvialis]|uniref:Uncharacterized protein n=1 Tax=Pseudomonas fluvialis TaxID=1793966 RepID=A0ABQ2AVM2_9PSED|nr:hypothetical protein [Pseudomonas fluvialis]GGH97198.1 hypothetical protein GCM10007363_30560 [Pseudomonas fluvialis]